MSKIYLEVRSGATVVFESVETDEANLESIEQWWMQLVKDCYDVKEKPNADSPWKPEFTVEIKQGCVGLKNRNGLKTILTTTQIPNFIAEIKRV